jgi:hypothetical protein
MSTETDLRLAKPDDQPDFEATALEPVAPPGYEDEDSCRHARDRDECGPNEVWTHGTAALIRGWADAIFRLANVSSLNEGLALSAIRPMAVAFVQPANGLVEGTHGSFTARPALKVVSTDPEG